jgi:hypothetical protein
MRIAEMARAARQAIKDGDLEKAEELSKQMSLMVSQLPVWAQSKMTRFYEPDAEGLLVDTIIEARRRNMPNLDIHDDREGE